MKHHRDANHREIERGLRAALGASVLDLSAVGGGCPDLLVAFRGANYLIEIKNERGKNRLEPSQILFQQQWLGPIIVARTTMEAVVELSALSAKRSR